MGRVTSDDATFYQFRKRYGARPDPPSRTTTLYQVRCRWSDQLSWLGGSPPPLRPAWQYKGVTRPWAGGAVVPRAACHGAAPRQPRHGTRRGTRAGRRAQQRRHRMDRDEEGRHLCPERPPPVRRLMTPILICRPASDRHWARPATASAIYIREQPLQSPSLDTTPLMTPGAGVVHTSALSVSVESPISAAPERHLLRPPSLAIRQTRQAEIRAAAAASSALKVGHLNVRSLTAHLDEVNLMLLREELDVACLSETWLSETVDSSVLLFPGYSICRHDRRKKQSGGGVAIVYRSTLRVERLRVPACHSSLEALWLQIRSRSLIIVGALYRPPSGPTAPAIDDLHHQLTSVLARDLPTYVLGDLN